MVTQTVGRNTELNRQKGLGRVDCVKIALSAALPSILAVLVVQAVALSIWPEIASFKPLDSYARSVIFTLVPAIVATMLFGRLYKTRPDPVSPFLKISVFVLLLSFIPDFILPVPNRTLLASSVAAFLHLTAAIFTIGGIVTAYKKIVRN